ncbi:MAG: AbrB/MazE/SpoVT family DNA-binding domain-containing protein, partial [Nitrospirales bacterium]|nr:AbrB/MazE/SpoVT family DNA-binding domain-containing protein [Nitrospirales bacterium]
MATTIKTRIVKIGNSQGIRIPKYVLEQTNLGEEVELELQEDRIIIRQVNHIRHDWEEKFVAMAEAGDDKLLDGEIHLPTE